MRLINADALIQSLEKKHEHWHELVPEENKEIEFAHSYALNVIRNAPTADVKPTVIQSKTLMPTKDFKEWAKRIKEVNPNAVVIPCDAEVASAEAVQEWIPCSERLPNESGWYVISVVGFENITDVSYFYSDEAKWSDVSHTQSVVAWMQLPKPYKEDDNEN